MGGTNLRGRSEELRLIEQAVTSPQTGALSAVVALVGDAGIGKSMLASAAARRIQESGRVVVWGRAWEGGGQPPFWPWRMLFEDLAARGLLSRSEAPERLWCRAAGGSSMDPEQSRLDLFERVATAVTSAAQKHQLVCVLEDLHAADLPSLELLHFVAQCLRHLSIGWLLTWRGAETEGTSRAPLLRSITKSARLLQLAPLSSDAMDQIIDDLAGHTPDDLRNALQLSTEGNPLFLVETLASLASRNATKGLGPVGELPLAGGVVAMVSERTAALSEPVRTSLQAACALGRSVDLHAWIRATELNADRLREHAAQLEVAGILRRDKQDGHWMLSHELVRLAILSTTAPATLCLARARVARALDDQVRAGDISRIGERAHFAILGRGQLPVASVLQWVLEGSDQARAQCAYEESLAILERAAEALPDCEGQPGWLLALGRAQAVLGQVQAARRTLDSAMARARVDGDARAHGEAVLAYGERYVLGDVLDDLIERIDRALGLLQPDERRLRARLLARKAAALTPARDVPGTLAIARQARELLTPEDPVSDRVEVAIAVGSAMADFAPAGERLALNTQLMQLAREQGERGVELRGLSRLITDHLELGDTVRADLLIADRQAIVQDLGQPRLIWTQPLFRSMRAMGEGRWQDCERSIQEAQAIGTELQDPNVGRCLAVHRFHLSLARGDREALRAQESSVLEALRTMPSVLTTAIRALVRYRWDQLEHAREELAVLTPQLEHAATTTLALLSEVAADVGSSSLRRAILTRLAPLAGCYANWGLFALTSGPPVSACLGLLHASLGETEQARQAFEEGLAQSTAAGLSAQRVWVRRWYGGFLADSGQPEASRAMLDRAKLEADELEMPMVASVGLTTESEVAPIAMPGVSLVLEQQGADWCVGFGEQTFLVPDLRGMKMLARLVAQPGREIHVLDLVSEDGAALPDRGDAGEVLDAKALGQYRDRIRDLTLEVERLEAQNEGEAAIAAQRELEVIQSEVARAVGLGGRRRRAAAPAERARTSTQRRLRTAIRKIAEQNPLLGERLAREIRTGTFCIYLPEESD